jgi:hypothetical protein
VVITSDHGEALGERGLATHCYLYDFNLMVPLVFILPNQERAPRRVSDQVSLIDVLPTLLELTEIPSSVSLDGDSLVPLLEGKPSSSTREAWSYAAMTNYGLSLRIANELKYIYNNSAWPPVHGQEELYRLDRDRAEERNLAAKAPEVGRLRERVRQAFRATSRGISIRFGNAGDRTLRGTVQAPLLNPIKVKTPHLPCPCVAWSGDHVDVRVPAGQAFELILEDTGPGELVLQMTMGRDGPSFRSHLASEELSQTRRFALVGQSWQELDSNRRAGTVEILVKLKGDPGAELDSPRIDAAALEDLRALGYIR